MPSSEKGIYLRTLQDKYLPTRYSEGSKRRAGQLMQFWRDFQRRAQRELEVDGGLELWVLSRSDWNRVSSKPYGLPQLHARTARVLVASEYPLRFLHRFDDPLLEAGLQGFDTPGETRELLDLMAGMVWAQAFIKHTKGKTGSSFLDDVLATHLFLLTFQTMQMDALWERYVAWMGLFASFWNEDKELTSFDVRNKGRLERFLPYQAELSLKVFDNLPLSWDVWHELIALEEFKARNIYHTPIFRNW